MDCISDWGKIKYKDQGYWTPIGLWNSDNLTYLLLLWREISPDNPLPAETPAFILIIIEGLYNNDVSDYFLC